MIKTSFFASWYVKKLKEIDFSFTKGYTFSHLLTFHLIASRHFSCLQPSSDDSQINFQQCFIPSHTDTSHLMSFSFFSNTVHEHDPQIHHSQTFIHIFRIGLLNSGVPTVLGKASLE